MLVGSIVADEMLVRAIRYDHPELFRKLGEPVPLATIWNPVVGLKVVALVLLPSLYPAGSELHRRLWISRTWILGFFGSVALAAYASGA